MNIIDQIITITREFPEAQHRDLLELLFLESFGFGYVFAEPQVIHPEPMAVQ